jgi:hypothetical protein
MAQCWLNLKPSGGGQTNIVINVSLSGEKSGTENGTSGNLLWLLIEEKAYI